MADVRSPEVLTEGIIPVESVVSSMPKQVDDPDYHSENHTAAQTCGWTANALRGEGRCYKNHF